MSIFSKLFGKGKGHIFQRQIPTIIVDGEGWTRCPQCGWRFKITDQRAWDGEKHERCNTKLEIDQSQSLYDENVQVESAISSTAFVEGAVPELDFVGFGGDEFVRSCFEVSMQEKDDQRWYSSFDELPKIDEARKSADYDRALQLLDAGLEKHPDSFLFYERKANILNDIGKASAADAVCLEGISKCLSKTNLCESIGTSAFRQEADLKAVRWWIIACVVQTNSKLLVEHIPFLHLAYVAEGLGLTQDQQYLLEQADQISPSGPIRYNDEGAQMHYAIAKRLNADDVSTVIQALTALRTGYPPAMSS